MFTNSEAKDKLESRNVVVEPLPGVLFRAPYSEQKTGCRRTNFRVLRVAVRFLYLESDL